MIVRVDTATGRVELVEPDVLNRFHVEVSGDPGRVAEAMGPHGKAAPEADHVFVRIAELRALAEGQVEAGWAQRFERMLDYARSHGWLDETGEFVKAHVEVKPS